MRIQTKFSPNDKVAFDKDGQRVQGVIYSVVVTAFFCYQIVSYDVMCRVESRIRLYRIREDELTKIKNNDWLCIF